MSFLPRTRSGVLWRALLAGFLVVGFAAGATATAGLLQVNNLAVKFRGHAQAVKGLTLPAPGKPETILLIGSDHRGSNWQDYSNSNTDTMLLVRIDDSSQTINVMSVPRDLDVLGPGGSPVKLNSIYSTEGGPSGLLKVLKQQVFPKLQVTHVVDTSFIGFSNLIDAIGCVYTDVDHRYYNVTGPGANNFSSIDIQPGYQKLCGGVHSPTGTNSALAFVRFRHTDSDEVRNARQQDFIRWAKDGYSTTQLFNNRDQLIGIFARYTHTDKSLASTDGLINVANLVINANSHTLKTISFPEYFGTYTAGQAAYVYPCPDLPTCAGYGGPNPPIGEPTEATEAAWKEFVTPTKQKVVSASGATTATTPKTKHVHLHGPNLSGVSADPGDGVSQAGHLGHVGLPVYYPKYIYKPNAVAGYCFSLTANCDSGLEPESAYTGSYPRRYEIGGHKSYVMTLMINSDLGEYYTVQGTTWTKPPILNHPSKVVHVAGKELWEYDDGSKIAIVAIKTHSAVYWISNTLNNVISNTDMIAMGAELTRYTGKS